MTLVLKIGGNQLDDPAFVSGMAAAVKDMTTPPVIVHGGGASIKAVQEKLGIEARYVGGLRVTDSATLSVVMMTLIGAVNPMLVAALITAGVDAQGLNGADRGVLRGEKMTHPAGDLGNVGKITQVRVEVIQETLAAGVVPVIAPLMLGHDGGFYNCNADMAAGAVGAALQAEKVIFLTNVPGVLHEDTPITQISAAQISLLIEQKVITGGMAVKVKAALEALAEGVRQTVITDLNGLIQGTGTVVLADSQ